MYHATLNNLGDAFTFDHGDYYEKFTADGQPVTHDDCDDILAVSTTPAIAASKRPEAAVFAEIKNNVDATGDATGIGPPLTVSIYRFARQPDLDCSNTTVGDFAVLDEVRYRNPGSTPVTGVLDGTVTLPAQITWDVETAYHPQTTRQPGLDVAYEWALAVQAGIKRVLAGDGDYPESIAEWTGMSRPE